MTDSQKTQFQELRKVYPRMGKRWEPEEDAKLQQAYLKWQQESPRAFELFLQDLVKDFGRAAGGLKARLASYFDDVPGWDYEQAKERSEWKKVQKSKESEAVVLQFGAGKMAQLLSHYEDYVASKQDTFRKFVLRMSHRFEESRKVINALLAHHIPDLVQYTDEDIVVRKRAQAESTLDHVDFSSNPEAQEALRIMEQTHEHLFLTGEAGTGKSTLLQYFRQTTKKNVIVLAPTGVAALNVGGQTIHSFCAFGPDITMQKVKKLGSWSPKKKLLQKVTTIVIDEISMVRADLLDYVDKFLRLNGLSSQQSFGGYQMVFIGDLFQLPPVEKDFVQQSQSTNKYTNTTNQTVLLQPEVYSEHPDTHSRHSDYIYDSPYFFSSKAFQNAQFQHVQLKTIYRQQEQVFINLLNAVRNNVVQEEHLTILNERALQEASEKFSFEQFAIYLTPTNGRARQVNNFFLERVNAPLKTYPGTAAGTFENRELPTDLSLQIKIGAQVMMLNNDQRKRWVNGTMGKIVGISSSPSGKGQGEGGGYGSNQMRSTVIPAVADRPVTVSRAGTSDEALAKSEGRPESIIYEHEEQRQEDTDNDITISAADAILIELETGDTVYVQPYTWEMFKFTLDSKTQTIDSQVTGIFTQYPFKLAWAVTIHKAQGKTFNKVYIDLASGTFAHGQLYVALSRCRTLGGLHLRRPVTREDIILDPRVVEFLSRLPKRLP